MHKKVLITGILLLLLLPMVAANLRLSSVDYIKNTYPCKAASFSFSIENTGLYTETYYLGIDKFSEYTTFSYNPVVLNPATSLELFAFINAGCDITGSYNLNIIVRTLNSQQEVKLPIQLNIIENYEYDLLFGEYYVEDETIELSDGNYKVCEEGTERIPIVIDNKADVPNSYKLSLRGPKFASLTQNSAALNGLQKGVVFIDLEPKFEDRDTYSLTTYASSQRGDIKKKKTISIDVVECFKVDVELPEEAIISNCETSLYNFSIKNTGNYSETFNLYLKGPSWVSIDYDAEEIDSNDNEEAILELDAPCNKKGKEEISVKAISQDHDNIEDEKTISMKIIPKNKFYFTTIDIPRYNKIKYDAEELDLLIRNKGLREVDYSLSLVAPDWVDIEPDSFTLKPEGNGIAKLVFDLNEDIQEMNYAVTITANANGAEYSEEIILKLREEFLPDKINRAFNWLNFNLYRIIALIILIAMLIPAGIQVTKYIKNNSRQVKGVLKWVYMVLVAGIVLTGIGYFLKQFGWANINFTGIKDTVFSFFSNYVWYIVAGFIVAALVIAGLVVRDKLMSKPKKVVTKQISRKKSIVKRVSKKSNKKISRKKVSKKKSKRKDIRNKASKRKKR